MSPRNTCQASRVPRAVQQRICRIIPRNPTAKVQKIPARTATRVTGFAPSSCRPRICRQRRSGDRCHGAPSDVRPSSSNPLWPASIAPNPEPWALGARSTPAPAAWKPMDCLPPASLRRPRQARGPKPAARPEFCHWRNRQGQGTAQDTATASPLALRPPCGALGSAPLLEAADRRGRAVGRASSAILPLISPRAGIDRTRHAVNETLRFSSRWPVDAAD